MVKFTINVAGKVAMIESLVMKKQAMEQLMAMCLDELITVTAGGLCLFHQVGIPLKADQTALLI
jgi:hypothetical protein